MFVSNDRRCSPDINPVYLIHWLIELVRDQHVNFCYYDSSITYNVMFTDSYGNKHTFFAYSMNNQTSQAVLMSINMLPWMKLLTVNLRYLRLYNPELSINLPRVHNPIYFSDHVFDFFRKNMLEFNRKCVLKTKLQKHFFDYWSPTKLTPRASNSSRTHSTIMFVLLITY